MKPHAHQLRKYELPSIEWFRERYWYDPETGVVIGPSGKLLRGLVTGRHGSLQIGYRYDGRPRRIAVHRLAWVLVTGAWPDVIDHIDHNPRNNRWANLRDVDHLTNMRNKRCRGIWPGVGRCGGATWFVRVRVDGVLRASSRRDFCAAWKLRQRWLAERPPVVSAELPDLSAVMPPRQGNLFDWAAAPSLG